MASYRIHSDELYDTTSPFWESFPFLILKQVSFKDLVHETLKFKLSHAKVGFDKVLGVAFLELKPFVSIKEADCKPFEANVKDEQGKVICTLFGELELQHVPTYAQLVNGTANDTLVTGDLLLPGLPLPPNYAKQ